MRHRWRGGCGAPRAVGRLVWWGVEPPSRAGESSETVYCMPKCTPNKADPVGNHLYHVSEEVWTPSPGKGTEAAGGRGPPPKECDPGRQGCRTPRSGDGPPSDGQGGGQASCPRSGSVSLARDLENKTEAPVLTTICPLMRSLVLICALSLASLPAASAQARSQSRICLLLIQSQPCRHTYGAWPTGQPVTNLRMFVGGMLML